MLSFARYLREGLEVLVQMTDEMEIPFRLVVGTGPQLYTRREFRPDKFGTRPRGVKAPRANPQLPFRPKLASHQAMVTLLSK